VGAKPRSTFEVEGGTVVPMNANATLFVKMVLLQLGAKEFYDVYTKQVTDFMKSHVWGEERRLLAMQYVFREFGTTKPQRKWKLWVEQFCLSNPMRLYAPKYQKDAKGKMPFTDPRGKPLLAGELHRRYLAAAAALDLSVEAVDAIRSINGRMVREQQAVDQVLGTLPARTSVDLEGAVDLSGDPGAPTGGLVDEVPRKFKAPEEHVVTKDTWAGVKPISGREEMTWVKNHLALSGVSPADCPGPGAWAMYLNARSDPETFWKTWQTQVVKEDDNAKGRDAIAVATARQVEELDRLMEAMRKEAEE
jgi:hypothetical protein